MVGGKWVHIDEDYINLDNVTRINVGNNEVEVEFVNGKSQYYSESQAQLFVEKIIKPIERSIKGA